MVLSSSITLRLQRSSSHLDSVPKFEIDSSKNMAICMFVNRLKRSQCIAECICTARLVALICNPHVGGNLETRNTTLLLLHYGCNSTAIVLSLALVADCFTVLLLRYRSMWWLIDVCCQIKAFYHNGLDYESSCPRWTSFHFSIARLSICLSFLRHWVEQVPIFINSWEITRPQTVHSDYQHGPFPSGAPSCVEMVRYYEQQQAISQHDEKNLWEKIVTREGIYKNRFTGVAN